MIIETNLKILSKLIIRMKKIWHISPKYLLYQAVQLVAYEGLSCIPQFFSLLYGLPIFPVAAQP